jgi:hypothetical protein
MVVPMFVPRSGASDSVAGNLDEVGQRAKVGSADRLQDLAAVDSLPALSPHGTCAVDGADE